MNTATAEQTNPVLAHLQRKPDDDLRTIEAAMLLAVPIGEVEALMRPLVDSGQLEYAINDDMRWAYSLPENKATKPKSGASAARKAQQQSIPSSPFQRVTAPQPGAPIMASNSKRNNIVITADAIAGIKVETGVPVRGLFARAGNSKWAPLFDKLDKPDTSIAIPRNWKTAAAAEANKRNTKAKADKAGPTYRVALISETHARVWRTA